MKKILLIAAALLVGYTFLIGQHGSTFNEAPSSIAEPTTGTSDAVIANAFSNRERNRQVTGEGVVTRVLADDNSGARHQKFIIKLSSGQSLLIAHNIDLAPRISALRDGDSVRFHGEYEWNEKGGVLHWTHRDPHGTHAAGWLEHHGKRYQ